MPVHPGDAEVPLLGGTHGPVVRVGDTVRRAARPSTAMVHAVLRHLERVGFDGAPRALGLDAQGREVLRFIPGEVGVRINDVPAPPFTRTDATIHAVGRLLRRMHDATLSFVPPPDAEWSPQIGAPTDGDVICHNDIGPYNTVFSDGIPRAFIDWDGAHLGPRIWDVAYAAYRFVPYMPDEICTLIGWDAPPDRAARLRWLLDGYGMFAPDEALDAMERRIRAIIDTGVARHIAGEFDDLPMRGAWPDVIKPRLERDLRFVREQSR